MTSVAHEAWFRDPGLTRILSLLNTDGAAARVVGGAVRNSLMGIAVSDMDIATTLVPEQVQARAEAAGIRCVPTGIKHGTVTLVIDGRPFEVTTLRRDVETFGRHASVEFTDDWSADAERRDLTINALYADINGEVHDYTGGLDDIRTATIRFIGDAATRIAEDHLRILRFFRFFAHYGRGRPDADGLRACAAAKGKLSTLSAERVWGELKKLLSAQDPFRALLWMRTSGVLTAVLPESEKWGIDTLPALVNAEDRLGWSKEPLLRLAAIVPPDAPRLVAMAERLRMSKAEQAYFENFAGIAKIDDTIGSSELGRLLYRLPQAGIEARLRLDIARVIGQGEPEVDSLAQLARLQALLAKSVEWVRPVMPVKGADLIALGIAPGPDMGEKLALLEDRWVASNFSLSRDALLAGLSAG